MTDTEAPLSEPGIGARLRAARERAGLSTLQAASKLHLEPRMIEALEAEDFAAIGAPVFVRGHLRRYADLVDAPIGPLLETYDARGEAAVLPDLHRKGQAETMRPPHQLAGPVVGVIVAGAVIAGIWIALKGLPSATLPRTAPPAAAMPSAPPGTGGPATTNSAAPAPRADQPAAPEAMAGGDAAARSEAAPAPAGEVRVTLIFVADSWAEVYDSRNRRLYYDLGPAGTQIAVQGSAPLRVLIGYADGVTVDVEGRATPIPAGSRSGRRARFVVTSAGTLTPLS